MMKLWMALCLLIASSLPATAAVVREPYLQLVTPTSITIVWQTDVNSADTSRVQYGLQAGNLNQFALGAAVIPPSNAAVKNHVVTLTGLSPATTYFYNVGTVTDGVQGGGTTEHFFVTAPTVGTATAFRAWIVGDSGLNTLNQIAVRDAMLTQRPAPDLFLHMGDLAYQDGTDEEFTTNHFGIYQNILRHTPLWPTLGNHEARNSSSALGLGPYYEAHVLPTSGEAGGVASGTEAYYAFDYANVHFIVLDSMDSDRTPPGPMLTWLQADLAATSQEWVIAYWHHPPYTKGSHDSDNWADGGGRSTDMRETVLPMLEAGGVDLVLAGHSHIYERSYLIDQAYGYGSSPNFATPTFGTLQANGNILDAGDGDPSGAGAYEKEPGGLAHDGTIYVVAGHGGKSVSSTFGGAHPVMFFSEDEFGSVLLDITGSVLTVQNVRATGAITDTFTLTKKSLADIVWRNTDTGDVAVWLMNGLTIGPLGVLGGAAMTWAITGTGDMNGDGQTDLVWRETTTGDVGVWLMNELNAPTTGVIAGAVPAAWVLADVGDLDGDGQGDLVWRNTDTGDVVVWLMNGLTIGPSGTPGSAPTTWVIAGSGDVDGDGQADLVWRETTTGDVGVWLMNGLTATTMSVVAGAVPAAWTITDVGDLDGDGQADIVWRNTVTGDVAAWLMDGLTILGGSGSIAGGVPLEWVIEDMGDLDGNGKADLVWCKPSTGDVGGWLMDGLGVEGLGIIAGGVPLEWEIQ